MHVFSHHGEGCGNHLDSDHFVLPGAKLAVIAVDTGFAGYEGMEKLIYMIPGGIAGGLLGARFNRRLSEDFIERFFPSC